MKKRKVLFLVLLDIIAINYSYILALFFRFETNIPEKFLDISIRHILIITAIKIAIFYIFKLYSSIWEYASIDELMEIVVSVILANIFVSVYVILSNMNYSRSLFFIIPIIDLFFIGGIRFLFRTFKRFRGGMKKNGDYKRVIIVGAGAAGAMTLKELRNHQDLYSKPVAFIDDDPKKKGRSINGVPVLGDRNDIYDICEKYAIDEIIIAIPSAKGKDIKEILHHCKKTKCKTKILPGMYELLDGKVNVSKIRDVQIEDLLGREEIDLNLKELSNFISGKRIMITGGGGSIGSELCRQIARYNPETLMILDIYENSVYDIQNELLRKHKDLNLKIFISSIRDINRIDEIMKEERPEIIFHAAAHKHVPLMEFNPKAAIKNNVFGTLNMVQASCKNNVKKFVMVSTDKAVNPTNVMGATKRICEMIIQTFNGISNTDFVAVRFGNVLGSNGSVIPLFKKQIAEGGPVTVTDERVVRFFMTIPEACQLVLLACSMATGGEIFVLDMGEPVRIMDLARDLIQLSGFEPEKDIPIIITGLRPGEKLYEEILLDKENMIKTRHEKIYIEEPMEFEYDKLKESMELLNKALTSNSRKEIREILKIIVPSYNPYIPALDNNELKNKEEYDDIIIDRYIS